MLLLFLISPFDFGTHSRKNIFSESGNSEKTNCYREMQIYEDINCISFHLYYLKLKTFHVTWTILFILLYHDACARNINVFLQILNYNNFGKIVVVQSFLAKHDNIVLLTQFLLKCSNYISTYIETSFQITSILSTRLCIHVNLISNDNFMSQISL